MQPLTLFLARAWVCLVQLTLVESHRSSSAASEVDLRVSGVHALAVSSQCVLRVLQCDLMGGGALVQLIALGLARALQPPALDDGKAGQF
jgi:phage gp37-like protein